MISTCYAYVTKTVYHFIFTGKLRPSVTNTINHPLRAIVTTSNQNGAVKLGWLLTAAHFRGKFLFYFWKKKNRIFMCVTALNLTIFLRKYAFIHTYISIYMYILSNSYHLRLLKISVDFSLWYIFSFNFMKR